MPGDGAGHRRCAFDRKGDIVDVLAAVEDFLLAQATYRGRQTSMAEGVLRVAR